MDIPQNWAMQIFSFRHKRWARWVAAGLIGWLLLWVLGWLALPWALRSVGEKIGSEHLGRAVHIGQVDFLPWSLELTVRDVRIAGPSADSQPLFQLQRLYLNVQWQSLWHLAPVLDALELDAPVLHITQQAPGRYDVDDIVARLEAAKQPEPDNSGPVAFALHNVVLRNGAVEFQDDTVGRTHRLRQLQLQIPFLSNVPTQREIKVEPQLAFELNGSPFSSSAQATPFTPQRQADMVLRWSGLDLKPYLGYLPAGLPVHLQSALLDADLRVHFEQADQPMLRLSGRLAARQLHLSDAAQAKLLLVDALTLELGDVRPLERHVQLQSVQIEAPHVRVHRQRDGRWSWAAPQPSASTASSPQASTNSAPWTVAVDHIKVHQAQLDWQDDVPVTPARLQLQGLALEAHRLHWPLHKPIPFAGQMQLLAPGDGRTPAQLVFEGEAAARNAKLTLSVKDLPLGWARPYLAQQLLPQLDGLLKADLGLVWDDPNVVAQIAQLNINGLELACVPNTACVPAAAPGLALRGQNTLAELKQLQIEGAQIDLAKRAVTVQSMALTQPRLLVERGSDSRWMFERWLPVTQPQPSSVANAKQTAKEEPAWSVRWADLALHGGSVAFRDAATASPVAFLLSGLQVQLKDFAPLATNAPAAALRLSGRIGTGRTEPGRFEYDGTLALTPLATQGKLRLQQWPLHAFEPYVAQDLNVEMHRADGSFQGQLAYTQLSAGPQFTVQGDAALDDVRVRALASQQEIDKSTRLEPQQELLNWKSLALRGVALAMTPGQALQLDVRETALMDFFARVVLQEDGRLNLQNWRKTPPTPNLTSAAAPSSPVLPVVAAPVATPEPIIRIGPVTLSGGKVDFSDYFIKPNYSADLSQLTGRLSSFSSVPAAPGMPPLMADLELRGRAQGTASLDITGQLNPLAQPLALDIRGKMRDLELPPLSPYTIKYAGHGIERGKLNMDVHYQLQPNGQLTAGNQLVLHQLKFGDPVEGAPASLPVRLAVALLADRNGVIDVDLPINGSLNDPEFRLGAVIFKVVGNLIVKAVTAPFSLLTGLFNGGNELGVVTFAPGTAQLDTDARKNLDKVAKAMQDRPALNMTVVGQASATAEQEAWRQERLQQWVLAQKRRLAVQAGQDADTVEAVSEAEYPALLKEVYRRSDLKKERNFIGMTKDVPQEQMQAVLLESITVPDNAMRELALARAVAVRDYLAAQNLPLERLFLGAPTTVQADTTWTPQAELSLAVR